MPSSIPISFIRTTSRLLSISTTRSSTLRSTSYKRFRNNNIRQISSSTTTQNSNQASFTDRTLVIGLLTITTLIGLGFKTTTKSQQFDMSKIEQIQSLTSTKETDQQEVKNEINKDNNQEEESTSKTNESEQGGAFNPETGEINWDCPCLGGMAHGTCGEQFKAAFSCFVYSEQEPKGVECIEKFKLMQECFKDHPDEYGSELSDNDEPLNEEDGDFSSDSSNGDETSLPGSSSKGSELSNEDRELIPNRPSTIIKQENERIVNPISQDTSINEISSNSPDSTSITRSTENDSVGKSNRL